MDWQSVAHEFEPDGSLRDIYVPGTGLPEWQRVLDMLRGSAGDLRYTVDGEPAALPDRIEGIFEEQQEHSTALHFRVGSVGLACHFFTPDEIEFDLDPGEVTGLDQLRPLLDFMRALGELTRKTVILTPENGQHAPIFRFAPETDQLSYLPSPD